jgi:uncharacterized protein YdeI (YjbR/CyaY-like superfamily)
MAGVARWEPCEFRRRLAQDGAQSNGNSFHRLRRRARRRALLRVDRQSKVQVRRRALHAEVHTSRASEPIERAKADGRWDAAYDSPRNAAVPDDLQQALDASPAAAAFFATLTGSNRYAILYRIQDAKRADTRARRIEKFIDMLERGETIH